MRRITLQMSATKILWGQLVFVSAVALAFLWAATEWTAWRLGFQSQLGAAWFMVGGWPVYEPAAFFIWWSKFDAYAPVVFVQGAYLAASGGLAAIAAAIMLSVWRAKGAKEVTTYGSARWADAREVRRAGLLGLDGVVLGRFSRRYLRHNGPEHVLCFAPTRSGKGVGLVIPTLLTWPSSTIVHDIKGENFQLTSGWRARLGPVCCSIRPILKARRTTRCSRSEKAIAKSVTPKISPTSWSIPKGRLSAAIIGKRPVIPYSSGLFFMSFMRKPTRRSPASRTSCPIRLAPLKQR